jgi:hypothetical protein
MCLKERSLLGMFFLLIITFGFYWLYWSVKTKNEINCLGARIPTAFLVIIPFANFYFWYRYSQAFVTFVKKDSDPIAYFLLMSLLPVIGIFLVQDGLNDHIRKNMPRNVV